MVMVILYFGLRSKNGGYRNDAEWMPFPGGLRFHGSGIAYVDDLPIDRIKGQADRLTIEIIVTPGKGRRKGVLPLLILHDGTDQRQIVVWQYGDTLIVMNGDDYNNARRWPRLTGRNVLKPDAMRYLSITSDKENGTCLFVDGVLLTQKKGWHLGIPMQDQPLRLILGNSIYGDHGWTGSFHGVMLMEDALSAAQIKQRFEQWSMGAHFSSSQDQLTNLLFGVDQRSGSLEPEYYSDGPKLKIPTYLIALKRVFLVPPAYPINLNSAAIGDMVLNFIGFVPLGAVLVAFLKSFGWITKHPKWGALMVCGLLSLSVELVQGWIPSRCSTLLDLILNSLGAWIGIELMVRFYSVQKTMSSGPGQR